MTDTIALEARALSMPAGGVVRYVRGLVRAFAQDPFPLHLFVDRSHAAGEISPFPETVVPPRGDLLRLWWDACALPAAIKHLRPRLVHLTKPNGLLPFSGIPPVIMTIYDIIPLTAPETQTVAARAYWSLQLPRAVRRAEHILTISEWSCLEICDRLQVPRDRVTVTYPGIDEEFTRASVADVSVLRTRLSLPEPYLLTVGTIEPRKNVAILLRAFARVVDTIPHTLVVAGRWGWKTQAVRSAAQDRRLRGRVRFLGPVAAEDLIPLYSGADLFLFLSRDEGFGFPPLEAMACGTPVLVSTRGSLPEVTGPSAWVTEPEESAVADHLHDLLNNPSRLRARVGEGRQWVRRYQWSQTAAQTRAVYERFLQTTP